MSDAHQSPSGSLPGPAPSSAEADPGTAEARVERAVERSLADHLLHGRASADLFHVLLAGVTVFLLWSSLPAWAGLTWFAAFVLSAVARAMNRRRAITEGAGAGETLSVVRRDVWIAALLWGGWALLHIGAETKDLLFLLLIFSGLVAAGTSTLVADAKSFVGFMAFLFGPLTLAVSLSGMDRDHASMIALMVLFAPFMTVIHRRAHAILLEQLRSGERLKISQEEMARREKFLNALVTSAPSTVVVLDADGTVVRVNPAFEKALGFAAADAQGKAFLPLVTEDRERTAVATFLETIQDGRAASADLPLRKADGSTLWMRLSGTMALGLAEGTAILMGEDVTQQVEAREAQMLARIQAQEAARAKSAFLASMSHEIRTPMNGILGMVEILLDTPLEDDQRRIAEIIRSSGQGLLRILNDILDVSKIGLLAEVGRVFAGSAAEVENEILVDVGGGVPHAVRGDPHRLRQVLTNLVSNAVKFTRGGEVVISARYAGLVDDRHQVRFSVRDTGVGIPPEKHELVFRAFEQADSSTTRTHGGTGLGLSISQRLVDLMGGRIELESAPGKGSDFHFVLDLEPSTEVRSQDSRNGGAVELGTRRFLIVDDNATARRIVREALAHVGAACMEAEDVDTGLRLAREAVDKEAPFDAVVLDHMMPEKDGFDFARAVYEDEGYGKPRILMVTSGALSGDTQQARSLGVGGYMSKPVARTELLKALRVLLGSPRYEGPERRLITRETILRVAGKARILLAEDNPVNQQVAVALLTKQGHEVVAVTDGKQAVEAVRRDRFDLVLMDIQMPEMDGLEATRTIRRFADAEALPIVALTAHAFAEERERSRLAGMNDFLAKPFKPEDLYDLVDRWARVDDAEAGDREGGTRRDEVMQTERRDEVPVDLEGFRAVMRAAGVEEVVDTTIAIYLDDAPGIFEKIESSVEADDAEGVRKAAHSLKSASGNIRANRLYEMLQEMERLGRDGDVGGVRAAFPPLRSEFRAVMEYLESVAN